MGVHVDFELDEATSEYVRNHVGENGAHDTIEDYVIDLIRQDVDRRRAEFVAVKAELQAAFAAPEDSYVRVTAQDVIDRNRGKRNRAA